MYLKRNKVYAVFVVILTVFVLAVQSKNIIGFFYPMRYSNLILKYSSEYSLDPSLVSAVINVESRYKPDAESQKDAKGLMQITPSTGKWAAEKLDIESFSDEMLYNPEINIKIGCWYLDYLSKEFSGINQNTIIILAAYNGGSSNVKKWLKNSKFSKDGITLHEIPFKETEAYVEKVLRDYRIYKLLYDSLRL